MYSIVHYAYAYRIIEYIYMCVYIYKVRKGISGDKENMNLILLTGVGKPTPSDDLSPFHLQLTVSLVKMAKKYNR